MSRSFCMQGYLVPVFREISREASANKSFGFRMKTRFTSKRWGGPLYAAVSGDGGLASRRVPLGGVDAREFAGRCVRRGGSGVGGGNSFSRSGG